MTTGAEPGEGGRAPGRLYLSINTVHRKPQGRGGAEKPAQLQLLSFYLPRRGALPGPPLLLTGTCSLSQHHPRVVSTASWTMFCKLQSPSQVAPSDRTGVRPSLHLCVWGVGRDKEGGQGEQRPFVGPCDVVCRSFHPLEWSGSYPPPPGSCEGSGPMGLQVSTWLMDLGSIF